MQLLGASMRELITGPFVGVERALTGLAEGANQVLQVFEKFTNLPGIKQLIEVAGSVAAMVAPLVGVAGALLTLLPLLAKLGVAWQLLFSKSGLSVVGGFKDAIRGTGEEATSAAARAIAEGRAGMFQRTAYGAGGYLGQGGRMLGLGRAGDGPSLLSRVPGAAYNASRAGLRTLFTDPASLFLTEGAAAFRGGGALGDAVYNRPTSRMTERGANFLSGLPGRAGQLFASMGSGSDPTKGMEALAEAQKKAAASVSVRVGVVFDELAKKGVPLSESMSGLTASVAKNAESTTASSAAKVRETETSGVASASLLRLAASAGAAAVGTAATGIGKAGALAGAGLGRVGGAAMGLLGGPVGIGITAAAVGIPWALSQTKQMSQDQLDQSSGSYISNINKMATATGGAATSLEALTQASKQAAAAQADTATAWSPEEISKARDASFKSSGYTKDQKTTEQKVSALEQTQMGLIASGGTLNQSQQTAFRMQLEKLLPNTGDAKTAYDNFDKATNGIQHRQQRPVRTVPDLRQPRPVLHQQHQPGGPAAAPGTAPGPSARSPLVDPLAVLNTQSANATGAAQQVSSAQFAAGLVGAASTATGPGVSMGATHSFFRELAQKLGVPADTGNVSNLQDFVSNMFNSKNADTRNTATRLFGPQGSIDFSNSSSATAALQQRLDAANKQIQAQSAQTTNQNYSRFNLGQLGVLQGSAGATAAANIMGGTVPAGQEAQANNQAVMGLSQSLMNQSRSAADAEAALSAWRRRSTRPTRQRSPWLSR